MSMMSLFEFFHMGGRGVYVWSAYGITLIVLLWIASVPVIRRRKLEQSIRFKARAKARREATKGGETSTESES